MSLHRFLSRLIWLCVLPMVLLAAYLATSNVYREQGERNLEAEHIAKNFASAIDHNLSARASALNMLAMSPLADQVSRRQEFYQEAQSFHQSFGSHVIVADPQRHTLLNTRQPFGTPSTIVPQHKGRSAMLMALKTAKPEVGDVFFGPVANEPIVGVAVPGLRDGKTVFVVGTTIEIRQFQRRLEAVVLPSGWSLALLDGTGEAIARNGPPGINASPGDAFAKRFVVKSSVAPWSVVLDIPRDIYLAPLLKSAVALVLAILGATLAAVFGGRMASRQLGTAVASLAATSARGAPGSNITEIAAVGRLLDESLDKRDIAEAAQRASEARFRAIFEHAAAGIALLAPDGRWLLANQKLCDIVAYPRDELLTKTFQDITHPDDLPADLSHLRQMLAGEIDAFSMEKRYLRKDGAIVWINLSVALVRRPDGNPDYFIALIEDIQRRKEAEEALQASEATLREAQHIAGLGHWSWDLRTNRHAWSEEIYRIYGRDPNLPPMVYPDVQAYFTPDSWAHLTVAVEACLAQGTPYSCDAEVVRADGSHRWITIRGQATRDADGKVLELHGTMLDITARKQAELDIYEAGALQRAIFNSINFSSIATDAKGVIQIFNVGAERMLGYAALEVMNQVTPADISDPQELIARAKALSVELGTQIEPGFEALVFKASRGIEDIYELTYIRKDGSRFPAVVSVTALRDAQNAIIGYLLIGTDNTGRKLAADELIQHRHHLEQLVASRTAELAQARDAAESANHAKSLFLATMSHELRTPLNAVVGLTGLLADSPLGRRQRDYADKIQLAAQALRTLIDDILDFSKIEAGALCLEQAPVSLKAILRTLATVVGVGLGHKPIEALFEVAPDVPDALIGDALRLQQILLNLTSNAVKFTAAGVIVVSVRCLARDAGQVTLQFAVRDTGIGIPADQLVPIFDGFVQADMSTSRLHGGSGLGLTISARLATLMGGHISVDSLVGSGSEFRLDVTLALGVGEHQAAAPDLPRVLNILIIDDHPLARDILTRTCAGFGWQATAVDSGAAGLEALRHGGAASRDYDLVLLDWRMPGMDGLAMLRQAYATADINLPRVVLMASIFEMKQAVAASDDLHLDGIAPKPLTPASLYDAVTRAYAGEFAAILASSGKTDRRLAGMRLLVAEDNELNQEVIEQILTRAGAEVVVAANGLAAVAALRVPGARFDAVLMDIQMPVMDGYAATRIIREELGRVDLPIIAVTAFARPEDREKSRRAGMVGHLVKPLDVEDLLDLVAQERQRAAPQALASTIDLAGLDVGAALQAFGGDQKKYGNLLRKFVLHHGGDADEARRLFNTDNPKGASGLLHGLSGMASLLQATELARLAAAAEAALLDGKAELMPLLFNELQAAMRILGASVDQLEAMWADVQFGQ